jgi:YD repeat-containing protein
MRFITKDIYPGQLTSPGTMNGYANCLGDPVDLLDTNGLEPHGPGMADGWDASKRGITAGLGYLSIDLVWNGFGNPDPTQGTWRCGDWKPDVVGAGPGQGPKSLKYAPRTRESRHPGQRCRSNPGRRLTTGGLCGAGENPYDAACGATNARHRRRRSRPPGSTPVMPRGGSLRRALRRGHPHTFGYDLAGRLTTSTSSADEQGEAQRAFLDSGIYDWWPF